MRFYPIIALILVFFSAIDGSYAQVVAANDDAYTIENIEVTINIIANDYVEDVNNLDPESVDLDIVQGEVQFTFSTPQGDYQVDPSGILTFTPATGFTGTATSTYTVKNDVGDISNTATITITVHDRPIAVDDVINTDEDEQAIKNIISNDTDDDGINTATVDLDPTLSGIQSDFMTPQGNFLSVDGSGDVTLTPAANFNGIETVTYTVNDNLNATSDPATIIINISPANDAPVITGQTPSPLITDEEDPIIIDFAHLQVTDIETATYPSGFSLIVQDGDNYTVSGNTVTPDLNFEGLMQVIVMVNDGSDNSLPFLLQIDVNGSNDAPTINGQADAIDINEDTPFAILPSHLQIADPDLGASFTIIVSGGSNYTFSDNTITPAPNYTGPLTIPVQVSDGLLTSNSFDLQVAVTAVNDAPVIDNQAEVLITNEDQDIVIELNALSFTDIDNNAGFSLVIGAGNDYTFTGNTVTPDPHYSGTLSVPVMVNDGTDNSESFDIVISVTPVNDAPSITGYTTGLATDEDTPFTVLISHLQIVDPDFGASFTVLVSEGDDYTFTDNIITPSANYNGPLTISVQVSDGSLASNSFDLEITVAAVNDPPVIDDQAEVLSTSEDEDITIELSDLSFTDVDNGTGFSLVIGTGSNYTSSGNIITPASDFDGTLTVPVQVSDGTDLSESFDLVISVTPINDPPSITDQTAGLITTEDTPFTILPSHLTIEDPDNSTGFTITISAGTNYTFTETTITPDADYTGPLTIPIQVNDGNAFSTTFDFELQVNASNDPPSITGQADLNTNEETAFTLLISHLTISDPDHTSGFTLIVSSGNNYTFSGTTITPAADFNGPLLVNVQVSDGTSLSAVEEIELLVHPVNDIPSITDQITLNTNEETAFTILISHLTVSDPDNSAFTVLVSSGADYTISGSTITPSLNYNGLLTIPVRVSDGTATSAIFDLEVQVNAVNDVPKVTDQVPLSITEDSPLTLLLSHLTITDPDNTSGFSINVASGSNYTFSGTTITPSPNFTGTLNVNVTVSDGTVSSETFEVEILVSNTNDPPVITGQAPLTIDEETSLTLLLSHLVISDPDNTSGFTISISPGTDYTLSGTTITPITDFSGTISIPVSVSDGISNSNLFELQLQVDPVNDVPVIIGQTLLNTAEDTSITLDVSALTISDPDNNSGFILTVFSGTNYTFSGLTITPETDFNGTLDINVSVSDGTHDSPTFTLQVQVGNSNDPPVITGQVSLNTNEDEPITIQFSDLTVDDPDDTYPQGFTIITSSGENYTISGSTVTPAPDYFGTLTVPTRVNDGINNSPLYDLQITVNPVNDNPAFDPIADQRVMENSGEHTIAITNISKGSKETTQQLIFFANSGNTNIIADPAITYDGTAMTAELKFNTLPNVSGTVTITVRAIDNGSSPASFISTFQIEVVEVNNPPTLDPLVNISVLEDSPEIIIPLSGITAGAGENQPLTITVAYTRSELFETEPVINYQSPGNTGNLQLHPKPNASGDIDLTVTVEDNGSNEAPNINTVSRNFRLSIQAVNDLPVFRSTPITISATNELYTYEIEVTDVENEPITLALSEKPSWATLVTTGNGSGRLSGTVPSAGTFTFKIEAEDPSGVAAVQTYTLIVNTRPVLETIPVTTPEDQSIVIPFLAGYHDADDNTLASVKILSLPRAGILKLNDQNIKVGDTIPSSLISNVTYEPELNFSGMDSLLYTASDGIHFSIEDAHVMVTVTPVNDPPIIIKMETDTLKFEVTGTPQRITSEFEAEDPDDEMFIGADIGFNRLTFRPEYDVLLFQNTAAISGIFNSENGILVLSGIAPKSDYIEAIRSVQYNYLNTVNPILETKTINISITDGKNLSNPKERLLTLTYTFDDLKIPTGFTPNGDNINDTWIIAPEGGALMDAVIKVFNKKGRSVYEAVGFDDPWDGTYNGELLPPDTYYFTIDLQLPNGKTYKGFVTLLR